MLEPLSGYLLLGEKLYNNYSICGDAFNFGPKPETSYSVERLLIEMSKHWSDVKWRTIEENTKFNEAGLLKLNCDKALFHLKWLPNLSFNETISFVAKWYRNYYENSNESMLSFTKSQITEYVNIAAKQRLTWSK